MTTHKKGSAIPRRLVVDDTRTVAWDCTLVQTVEQALAFLADLDGPLDEMWLDFDLGFGADRQRLNVMPFVNVLVERATSGDPVPVDNVYVHSANLLGGRQVRKALEQAGYRVSVRHWAELRRVR